MANNAIVSFADDTGNYLQAMLRLKQSLNDVGFDGDFLGFTDYAEIGSPHHSVINYGFKAYAIQAAIEKGYDKILWCDSSCYAIKDVSQMFDHISNNGYLFFDNIGFSIGDYTSDYCLDYFGISRQEAYQKKMIMSGCMGFDTNNQLACQFLHQFITMGMAGSTFNGDWFNDNNQVSLDSNVKGHRHDQSVASLIIDKLGMKITNGYDTYFAITERIEHFKIADSVCMLCQGI